MRHVYGELGMAVEHAGIDQADRRHDQREFAADRTCRIEAIELLRIFNFSAGWTNTNMPSRATSVQNGSNSGHQETGPSVSEVITTPSKSKLVLAAVELAHCLRAAERVRMCRADEAAGIILLGLLGLAVARDASSRGPRTCLRAGETGRIDAGRRPSSRCARRGRRAANAWCSSARRARRSAG